MNSNVWLTIIAVVIIVALGYFFLYESPSTKDAIIEEEVIEDEIPPYEQEVIEDEDIEVDVGADLDL